MSYGATPRDDISAMPEGDHVWIVSIVGDVPLFPFGYPTVVAPRWFPAIEQAEKLLLATGVGRNRILLTRLERK